MSQNWAPFVGFPRIDHVDGGDQSWTDSMAASRTTAPQTTRLPSQLGKRGPGTECAKRRVSAQPLDALGLSAMRTRDHFGHIDASIKAHLTAKQLRLTGLRDSLIELQDTVAKDMKTAIDEAWRRGVMHGEWLKTGEGLVNAEAAAAAEELRQKVFELELQVVNQQHKYELARKRISELSTAQYSPPHRTPPPSPVHDADPLDISLEEILSSLADHSPISQESYSPVSV